MHNIATATDKLTVPPNLAVARTGDPVNQPLWQALDLVEEHLNFIVEEILLLLDVFEPHVPDETCILRTVYCFQFRSMWLARVK